MNEELLPCPFCGDDATTAAGIHHFNDIIVMCESCGVEGPLCDVDDGKPDELGRNRTAAHAAWNKRCP
jgi:Lar family restriction alleviation protein